MFASLRRAVPRRTLAAGLAALVATAGIGVAVAASPGRSPQSEIGSALTVGASEDVQEVVDGALVRVPKELDAPPTSPVVDQDDDEQEEVEEVEVETPPATASSRASGAASSSQASAPVDLDQFLPGGDQFDLGNFEDFLPDEGSGVEVAAGAEELSREVIARIQACVGDVMSQFGSGFAFDGAAGAAGAGANVGGAFDESFATGVVDDVLPCIAELVEDTLSCVSGLVQQVMATVMSMDFSEIAGLASVIVEELVDCAAANPA